MTHDARGAKVAKICKCCGSKFLARKADCDRGWAMYCSKSCKASHAAKSRRRHAHTARGRMPSAAEIADAYVTRNDPIACDDEHPLSSEALGQW